MTRQIGTIALGCVLVLIGIASGWFAARQGSGGAGEAEAEAAANDELSPQALKNLGVEIEAAKLSDFVRVARVQAEVVDSPLNQSPVPSLHGGVVMSIDVRPGQVVKAGTPLARVARSAIPRPQLALTQEILDPVDERMHGAVTNLRTALASQLIVTRELARVRKFTESTKSEDLPVLPRKREIELGYELERAKQTTKNAERELEWHGFSPEEIAHIREGGAPPPNRMLWQRALEKNGLWAQNEQAILDTLPEADRTKPWAIAAIGELSAAGLATKQLLAAMKEVPALRRRFVEASSLMLQGHSVAKVKLLAGHGALDPEVVLRAPDGAADWDVTDTPVSIGERVEVGQPVVVLHDPRIMWLQLEPAGAELGPVARAFKKGAMLRARPLVPDAGPVLTGLQIDRFETLGAKAHRGALGIIRAENTAVMGPGGRSRSWKLRVGLRYLVEVPVQVLPQRFVLPAEAVTDDGPERVVYVEDGKTFAVRPVHVEYEDEDVAVIANDGSLFPGDPVVTKGAFALGLALQSGSGAVDPHAGHDHG
ncbi:MAG: hypothetical protein ACYTGZ_10545 [Planctomycetota bacterium]|jgi:multidrug efflux pump subunit AcrA (membrane-fusion protein)